VEDLCFACLDEPEPRVEECEVRKEAVKMGVEVEEDDLTEVAVV
jgi:hypothetical protein